MKHVGAILSKNGVEWWAEGEFIGESDGIDIELSIEILPLHCTEAGYTEYDGSQKFVFLKIDSNRDPLTIENMEKMASAGKRYNLAINGHLLGHFEITEVMGYDRLGECNPVSAKFSQSKEFGEVFEEFEKVKELNEAIFLFDSTRKCVEIHFVRRL